MYFDNNFPQLCVVLSYLLWHLTSKTNDTARWSWPSIACLLAFLVTAFSEIIGTAMGNDSSLLIDSLVSIFFPCSTHSSQV